jgi:predicted short-subunit dehydrogenase-like oxidoreductase (DUF2520 family)
MKNIILVGSGNVATHLGIALQNCNYKIVQVYSRNIENAKKLAQKLNTNFTNDLTQLKTADLIIVSVNDDAISTVLSKLENTAIVHTSGSVGMDVFEPNFSDFGVFYPLQTFNKDIELTISEIPFCIEGSSKAFEKELIEIAKNLSSNVITMNSTQRKQLHIAAVFACNFSNQMFSIADDLLAEKDINFKILLPLIKQTIAKLNTNKPKAVQTGPAQRKDLQTIKNQINLLEDDDLRNMYKLSTNQILRQK